MSQVQVVSDDGETIIPILSGNDDEGDAWTTAVCPLHGDLDGDHSYFEDMVQVAELHVDQKH